ncbi:hypothetical protein PMI14_04141 [Acidovorax sp. CF316]|nr:hypothetical protein PMI14_04141 [Acidovorax sp. CF316]
MCDHAVAGAGWLRMALPNETAAWTIPAAVVFWC